MSWRFPPLFRGNDKEAFQRLYEDHQLLVRRVLFNLVGAQPLEDLTQEVFLRVWKALPKFGFRSSLKTWIYRISVNVATDHLRKQKARTAEADGPVADQVHEVPLADPKQLSLSKALEELDEEHRSVVVLHYFESLSVGQIARVLEIPVGTVKSRLYNARRKLKVSLNEKGVET